MDNLELLKIAENQDVEAYEHDDFEEKETDKNFKKKYDDYYDDIKQSNRYIKEDW